MKAGNRYGLSEEKLSLRKFRRKIKFFVDIICILDPITFFSSKESLIKL